MVLLALLAAGTCSSSCDRAPNSPAAHAVPPTPTIHREQRAASGDFSVQLTTIADRTDLTVADRMNLAFTCTTRTAASITLPEIGAQLGDFTVASSAKSDRLDPTGNRITTLSIVLEPFLSGDKSVPPLTFQATDGSKTITLKTEPITAHITAIADAAADAKTPLEPAKSPVELNLPAASRRIALYATIAGVTVAIAAALGFAALTTSRRQKQQADPAFRARRELIATRTFLSQSSTRADASVASEHLFRAFATYLATALHIPADTQPSATIAAAISTSSTFSADQRNELNALLAELERIRFAPDAANVPAVQSLLDRVASFINQTSPSEVRA